MSLFFRNATLHDLPEIDEMVKAAIMHMQIQGINQWDAIYPTRDDFKEDIEQNQLYVGIQNDKIAITYTLSPKFDKEYENGEWKKPEVTFTVLHRLCVNPIFQNQGIAGQTMRQIEETAEKQGIGAIRLDVFSDNPYALRLYKKCGYQKTGTATWRKGEFYLMEKYL